MASIEGSYRLLLPLTGQPGEQPHLRPVLRTGTRHVCASHGGVKSFLEGEERLNERTRNVHVCP